MREKRRSGFTLIELLVVLSIVALLMGLLLPVLSRARPAAQAVQCMSHLRQLAVAQQAYHIEHDRFARLWAGSMSDGEAVNVTVITPLQEMLGLDVDGARRLTEAGSVMHCPTVQAEDFDELRGKGLRPFPGEQFSSYGINGAMYFDRWGFSASVIPSPSSIIILGEQALEPFERMVTSDGIYVTPGFVRWTPLANHDPDRGYRHDARGGNMAYADGHVAMTMHEALPLDGGRWHWWDASGDPFDMNEPERCGCDE
ncbi:type II secretion system protein [Mucisphaera sp.]|uniref:type II secretion system protein n=1 Tax=Mucisphaera sp. TaxID=2913024 RepID=UPI003D140EAC